MTALFHDGDKLWILFVEASGLEPLLTSMILLSVISHLPWVNTDLFKQAITSMASPLLTLLLTGMFGYVKGCLISLCLHRVSLKVATLCTAGVCLASNVKPGSLWNLTKASSGRGWKFTLIFWDTKAFSFDTPWQVRDTRSHLSSCIHAAVGWTQIQWKYLCPSFFSLDVSVSRWYLTNVYFSHYASVSTSRIGYQNYRWSLSCSFKTDTYARGVNALPR